MIDPRRHPKPGQFDDRPAVVVEPGTGVAATASETSSSEMASGPADVDPGHTVPRVGQRRCYPQAPATTELESAASAGETLYQIQRLCG